jgi:conjugative transfer region protein (TIGR03750 family)
VLGIVGAVVLIFASYLLTEAAGVIWSGMADRHDILADRLNAEPAIFKGCSSSELGAIVGVAALVWSPVSLILAGLAGAVTMGFGIAGVGIVATVLLMASLFQRLKRNRPDGYYQQRIVLWLDDRRLRRSPFVRRSGAWDIGRTAHATLPLRDR